MKTFIAAVAFACLVQLHVCNAKVRTFEKSFSPNNIDYFSIDDGLLTYVQCDKENPADHCKIEQLSVSHNETKFSCEVSLKKDEGFKHTIFHTFGKDKFIVVQSLEDEIIVFTVHLSDCKISQGVHLSEIKNPGFYGSIGYQLKEYSLIVPYADWFHIYFHDVDRCGNKQCGLAISAKGEYIIGPIPELDYQHVDNFIDTVYSIGDETSLKGHVYLTNSLDGHQHFVSVAHHERGEKQLVNYTDTNSVRLYVSNELFGTCVFFSSNTNITCTQYDNSGNIKLQKDFTVKTIPVYLYNLPQGGFLVFVMATENIEERDAYAELYVQKINAAGETVGRVSVQGLDSTKKWSPIVAPSMTRLWQDEESKEYCVSFISSVKPIVNVNVNCFDDNDFVH